MYTAQDHQDLELAHDLLHWASQLVDRVMERNRLDLTMQMVSLLSGAKHDADVSEQEVAMAEKYMQWKRPVLRDGSWQQSKRGDVA